MAACVLTLAAFAQRFGAISAKARVAKRLAWVAGQQHVIHDPNFRRSALWLPAVS